MLWVEKNNSWNIRCKWQYLQDMEEPSYHGVAVFPQRCFCHRFTAQQLRLPGAGRALLSGGWRKSFCGPFPLHGPYVWHLWLRSQWAMLMTFGVHVIFLHRGTPYKYLASSMLHGGCFKKGRVGFIWPIDFQLATLIDAACCWSPARLILWALRMFSVSHIAMHWT